MPEGNGHRAILAEPLLLSLSPPTPHLACIGPYRPTRAGTPVKILMRSCWADLSLVHGEAKDGTHVWGWVRSQLLSRCAGVD